MSTSNHLVFGRQPSQQPQIARRIITATAFMHSNGVYAQPGSKATRALCRLSERYEQVVLFAIAAAVSSIS
jgi:hypothetical protein